MSEERKQKISIGLYPSLIGRLDEVCEKEQRSRSNLIEMILSRHLPEFEMTLPSRPMARSVR